MRTCQIADQSLRIATSQHSLTQAEVAEYAGLFKRAVKRWKSTSRETALHMPARAPSAWAEGLVRAASAQAVCPPAELDAFEVSGVQMPRTGQKRKRDVLQLLRRKTPLTWTAARGDRWITTRQSRLAPAPAVIGALIN